MERRLTPTGKQAVAPAPGGGDFSVTAPSSAGAINATSACRSGSANQGAPIPCPAAPRHHQSELRRCVFYSASLPTASCVSGVASSRNLTVVMKKGGHLPALLFSWRTERYAAA